MTDKKVDEAKTKLRRIKENYESMSGQKFPEAPGARAAVTCFSLINAAAHMALLAVQAQASGDDPGPYMEMSNMFQTAADAQGC